MYKDFLDVFSNVMTQSLLLNNKESAAGLYSIPFCNGQDMHQDLRVAPLCRQRHGPKVAIRRYWDDRRGIPGLMVLGDKPQGLQIVMGSHLLTEVRTIDHLFHACPTTSSNIIEALMLLRR
jgi:hypothetical protein